MLFLQIADCSDDASIRKLWDSDGYNFRFECGLCKPSSMLNVTQKEEIIAAITLHYLVFRVLGEIEQFAQGLKETLNFGHLLKVCSCILLVGRSANRASIKIAMHM